MSKLKLKEKVLIWYDHVFNYDEALFEQPNFWDEFFLLRFFISTLRKFWHFRESNPQIKICSRPKYEPLKEKVLATTTENKKSIQLLVDQCLDKIENGSTIQCANGLQTISQSFKCILRVRSSAFFEPVVAPFMNCYIYKSHICAENRNL